MVRHYKQRGAGIRYWEVANEPDIGEDGGCPYRFTPENYLPLLPAHRRRDSTRRSRGARRRTRRCQSPVADSAGAARLRRRRQGAAALRFLAHLQQRPGRRAAEPSTTRMALLAKHPDLKAGDDSSTNGICRCRTPFRILAFSLRTLWRRRGKWSMPASTIRATIISAITTWT